MSKVVRFHQQGPPEVLSIDEVDLGEPGPTEVRMRVDALGLNRAEATWRSGDYVEEPKSLPAQLGYEAAGVVEVAGSDVEGFVPGDAVSVVPAFSMNEYGVYGDTAIVPAHSLIKIPTELDAVTSAATWMPYLTAFGALLDIGGMRSGDYVLITAASSSVGLAAIQIANRTGAIPIAVTRTSAKSAVLFEHGAEYVIASEEEDLVGRVQEITQGHGADFVFDPIGGPLLRTLAAATATGGTLFVYGYLSLAPTPYPGMETLPALNMRSYQLFEVTKNPARLARGVRYIVSGLKHGFITPAVDRTFDLSDIVKAHHYLESNAQVGKIVVTVDHS
ncbi:MAG: NADPH:quinone reductase [Gordonia sp. (in: high G+C Gram-positive bacteria)]|nr:MAG: NADPH:quinone reductase [Gordonia sp. (in: high G+C Gram-positive bacteria)]